jgi:hypothetical protein
VKRKFTRMISVGPRASDLFYMHQGSREPLIIGRVDSLVGLSLLDVKCTGKQIVRSRAEDKKELLAGGGREADARMADARVDKSESGTRRRRDALREETDEIEGAQHKGTERGFGATKGSRERGRRR